MVNLSLHSSFKLNGNSFADKNEFLSYVEINSIDGFGFLESWFDNNDFVIARTSGSTGTPKNIKISKVQMLNSASATGEYFDLIKGTKSLLCMSSSFIAGKMMWVRALSLGWELDVVTVNSNPLEKVTKNYDFAAMVPLQVFNSIDKLNLVKTLIIGGGVVSKKLQSQLESLSTNVFSTYGMTETVTHIAVKKINHFRGGVKGDYNTLPSVSIDIDSRGCLVIVAPLIADEKVVTNDLIVLKSDTSFEWLGRYDSVINSGGLKLIPEQIEKEISKVISENFFIAGIQDFRFGEIVILVIEGKGDKVVDKNEIKEFLKNARLKPYEVPKEIHFVKTFELTQTGKIKRVVVLDKLN